MYPVVNVMVDDLCEVAKREMKEKNDGDLGSWKQAVTTADGTWQTRGWHSKNAIRNYLNGALLYYHHLCQKGRDEGDLYLGTSKSAEGYAARVTFQRAKEEGMDVAIHWQDADSSSAKGYIPRLKSCCVVVMLIEKFWKNVRKIVYHQPILKSIRLISPSYVRRSIRVVNVWCITAVDVAVLVTPLYPKHTPISLLF